MEILMLARSRSGGSGSFRTQNRSNLRSTSSSTLLQRSSTRLREAKRYKGQFFGKFTFNSWDEKTYIPSKKTTLRSSSNPSPTNPEQIHAVQDLGHVKKYGLLGVEKFLADQHKEKENRGLIKDRYHLSPVENRIREEIAKGEWQNSPYFGKPLPRDPEIELGMDPFEQHCYKLLLRNQVLPEWVELNKKIHTLFNEAREDIKQAYILVTVPRHVDKAKIRQDLSERHPPHILESQLAVVVNNPLLGHVFRNPLHSVYKMFYRRRIQWINDEAERECKRRQQNQLSESQKQLIWETKYLEFIKRIDHINKQIHRYNILVPWLIQKWTFDAGAVIDDIKQEVAEIRQREELERQRKDEEWERNRLRSDMTVSDADNNNNNNNDQNESEDSLLHKRFTAAFRNLSSPLQSKSWFSSNQL